MKLAATLALVATLAAAPAFAQPAPAAKPLAQAFTTAVRACVANVQGKLPFDPPSKALSDAGVVLADTSAPDELKAFSDLNVRQRIFAAVPSTPGNVIVASDPSQKMCRVVIVDATPTQIGPIYNTPVLNGSNSWKATDGDPLQGLNVWSGSVLGSPTLTIRTRTPPAGSTQFGAAKYMFTVIAP